MTARILAEKMKELEKKKLIQVVNEELLGKGRVEKVERSKAG